MLYCFHNGARRWTAHQESRWTVGAERGAERETAGPGADDETTTNNDRPTAFRESILAHANALGEPVDPGLAALFATGLSLLLLRLLQVLDEAKEIDDQPKERRLLLPHPRQLLPTLRKPLVLLQRLKSNGWRGQTVM